MVGERPDRRTGGPAVGDGDAHRPTDRATPSPSLLRESPIPDGDSTVPRLELKEWGHHYGVVAGVTTRPANLGLWSEENVGPVMTRWRALCAAFRPAFPTVVLSHQVHGTVVHWHRQTTDGWLILDGIDGHATGTRGILLTITLADCVPVYLAVPQKGVVALLHAGWRGTAGRILERGVDVMRREVFVEASDILMHCGVGICGACYEVGPEVRTKLSGRPEAAPGHVDLRDVLVRQAHELGVTQVSRSPWCSAHDREHFFSHRGSGGSDGRMVAYLGVPA